MTSWLRGKVGEHEPPRSPSLIPTLTRVMLPTTRHLFVYLLFASLFVMAAREISDPDFWWHLRTGEYIVETRSVPHTDVFSFTASGKEWVTHEWLSEVLIFLLYRASGSALLIVTFAGVITAAFALAFLRCNARPFVAGFVVLLGALASAPIWGVRPQILSLLLTSIFLFLLDRFREAGEPKLIVPLVPLMILWVNLHSGYALGLVLIAVYLAVMAIQHIGSPNPTGSRGDIRGLLVVFVLSVASVSLSPNGVRMYSYPFETLTSPAMQRYIQEWFSPDFHLIEFQPFGLLIIALIGSALWSRARIPPTSIILVIIFGYASLRSARNIPIFALVAIPVLAQQVAEGIKGQGWRIDDATIAPTPRPLAAFNGIIVLALLAIVGLRVYTVAGNQPNVEQSTFPANAVSFIQTEHPAPNLYNAYGWGGYLIWRLYPQYRVYIDGRADVYGDAFIQEYLKIYRAEPGWIDQLAKRDVRLVIIEPDSPLALAMVNNPNWHQVYADATSVLFERK